MKKYTVILLAFVSTQLFGEPRLRPDTWARPVLSENLKNWHKLDDMVYRSAQPDRKGFEDALKMGIQNVLNLRDHHSDADEARGLPLTLYRVEMKAHKITDDAVISSLRIIKNSKGPVLIHCLHGADRTGTICAMYRIVFQRWSQDEAIDELMNGGFGYHAMFGNIPLYIRNADIRSIRKKVFTYSPRQDQVRRISSI